MSDLFRKEAVAHKTQRLHGSVILARSWSYSALTLFFCGIVCALVAFALTFGFSRKETINGMVVPDSGLLRITAHQSGVITHVYVIEGQDIQAGDPLFLLTSERTSVQGNTQESVNDTLKSRIAHLNKELEQQTRQTRNRQVELTQRLTNLDASLKKLDAELLLQRQKIQIIQEVAHELAYEPMAVLSALETAEISGGAEIDSQPPV